VSATAVLPSAQEKRACARAPCPLDTVAGPDAAAPAVGIENPGYPRLEAGGALGSASVGVGVDL